MYKEAKSLLLAQKYMIIHFSG